MYMEVNDKQIGGDHYKNSAYQHWDFVTDLQIPYLNAAVIKYLTRYRKKNGIEDLEKAVHYLEKAVTQFEGLKKISLKDQRLVEYYILANKIESAQIWGAIQHLAENGVHGAKNMIELHIDYLKRQKEESNEE